MLKQRSQSKTCILPRLQDDGLQSVWRLALVRDVQGMQSIGAYVPVRIFSRKYCTGY